MNSVLQVPSKPVPKFLKAQNAAMVKFDELGLHGISFTKNTGHFPRHLAINSILKRSLTCIKLPSSLEPVDLTGNVRRHDGLIIGGWYRGQSLVWDATRRHFCLVPLQRQCQTGRHCSNKD